MYFILLRSVFILCSLLLNSIFFVYAMEEQLPANNTQITLVNTATLKNDIFTSKSLFFTVLDTNKNNDNTHLIYTPVQNDEKVSISIVKYDQINTYHIEGTSICNLEAPVDSQLKNITTYAKYTEKKGSSYIFYIANDENIIYKVTFNTGKTPTLVTTQLYKHNSSVVHMNLIVDNDQQYLVTGSTYPSIKIYDLSTFKTVTTMHNRFLLGSIDNTIVYAKKNAEPSTFVGRWVASWKKDTLFDCTMYYLNDFFDFKKETYFGAPIQIIPNKYPIIGQDKLNLHVLNKDKIIIIQKQKNAFTKQNIETTNVQVHSQEPIIIIIETKDESHNQFKSLKYVDFKLKIENIFTSKDFDLYFKQYIMAKSTQELFEKQYYNPTYNLDQRTNENFIKFIIKNIFSAIINVEDSKLNNAVKTIFKSLKETKATLLKNNYNKNDYNYFLTLSKNRKALLETDMFLISLYLKDKKNLIHLKNVEFKQDPNAPKMVYNYTFNNIKKLYAHENLIVIQENNTLFYTNSNDPERHFYEFPIELQKQEQILHALVHQNTIGVITNQRLINFQINQNT